MNVPWRARRSEERPSAGGAAAGGGPRLRTRLLIAALVGLGVLAFDRAAGDGAEPRRLELLSLDWRFRLRGSLAPGPEVALVMIDDRSVAALGQWPAPRDTIAAAVRRLTEGGAGLVVLNLLLSEPAPPLRPAAREAMEAALPLLPPGAEGARAEIEGLLRQDLAGTRLAAAVAEAGRVVLPYAFAFDGRGTAADATAAVPPWVAATAYPTHLRPRGQAAPPDLGASGLLAPPPGLAAAAAGHGHATLLVDVDGALRFDLPAFPYGGEDYYPSLAVEAARLRLGLARDRVVPWLGEGLRLDETWLPLDGRSRLLVNHYGPEGSFETASFADLLDGRLDPGRLAGRIVVLGASAAATGDRFATPFTSRLPGSEHLATVIDNLLHGRPLRRDGPVRLADGLAIMGLAAAAAFLSGRRSFLLSLLATGALAAGWVAATVQAFAAAGVWLAAVTPLAAVLLAGGAVEALRAGLEQRRRRRLERQRLNLARYFPPAVVDRLATSDRPSGLERTQEAAVLFVDMIGFTRTSEGLSPAEAMDLLRAFHRRVEAAVFAHGGMVDKFMGDGALACFGVPDPRPAAAADALRAARAILAAIGQWGRELEAEGRPPVRVGIGVHVGPVLMGDIGGERQFQFTVVGDTVNVASRLESLTRQVGASVVVSAAVVEAAREAGETALLDGFEPLPPQQLRGRDGWLTVWRLPAVPLDRAARPAEPAPSLTGA